MKTRHTIPILATLLAALLVACASIGNPDGGAYDETPPRVLSASPADRSVMNRRKKVNIYFDDVRQMRGTQASTVGLFLKIKNFGDVKEVVYSN